MGSYARVRNFKCPFCVLQVDGLDPFHELRQWIEQVNQDLRTLSQITAQASELEVQILSQPPGSYGEYNSRATQARSQLLKRLQEAASRIQALSSY